MSSVAELLSLHFVVLIKANIVVMLAFLSLADE